MAPPATGTRGPRAIPHRTTLQRLNAELALAALERGDGYALHRPLHVAVQIASGCNLECYMCLEHVRPFEERRARNLKSFSLELFHELEREVLPYSSRMTFGIGGEPTLAENFEYFLQRAFELGQETELITNATRFGFGTLAETIARTVAYLQISIDGATAATYERIRVGSRFAHVVANIELLNRHRARYPRDERTHVGMWVTLMASNVHELPAMVDLAARLEFDRIHAHHATPITPEGAADTLLGQPELWNRYRLLAIERARATGIEIDVPVPMESASVAPAVSPVSPVSPALPAAPSGASAPSDPRADIRRQDLRYSRLAEYAVPCHLPATALYVLWDGRVVPCCYPYAQEKMSTGDLGRQSFNEIWNGPRYRALRAGMKRGEVLAICRHCPVVHDVPITLEAEAEMRASPTLEQWLEQRPALANAGATVDVLDSLRAGAALTELDDLRRHAGALEKLRGHLEAHVANLEGERPHLLAHIANLEAERARKRR